MSFIGLDIGTSFLKAALIDLDAFRLEQIRREPFPRQLPLDNPLLCEFDPEEVAGAARTIILDLLQHSTDCEGIVMCSQMHGMVLVDEKGRTRSNFISWMDHRGNIAHPFSSGTFIDQIFERTTSDMRGQLGNELNLERPACFLFCMSEAHELDRGLLPLSIADYVLSTLCGSRPVTDITNASASGLLNLHQLNWDADAVDALGLNSVHFPDILQPGEIAGHFRVGNRSVPCYLPVGDFQCALLGALLDPSELSVNVSTGAQVSRITSKLELGKHQTRPFFDQHFLNTITDAPGGHSFDVLFNPLRQFAIAQGIQSTNDVTWSFVSQALTSVHETDLKIDLTVGNHAGWISNMRSDNFTPGHLFRAAFEGMAEAYELHANHLWPERAWKNIVLSGGLASKAEVLREVIRARLNAPYRLSPLAEDTLFGLLMVAHVYSRRSKSVTELSDRLRADPSSSTREYVYMKKNAEM